jgi:hypothetical protein
MSKIFTVGLALMLAMGNLAIGQRISNGELLTILDIKAYRVPSFVKKQWTIEIIPDTLQQREAINVKRVLSSKTTSLIAIKFDDDSTLSFTLIQNKNSSSKGDFRLKSTRYDITWNNFPEFLYNNTFVIAKISYEQRDEQPFEHLTDLLVVELIDELKL